ncbi:MAG: Lrp/AsnC family transcriptional regulator [Actinomycetota bacterium]|nr:Lrp/AsnC family transcriptional regulator [Actinomycetota bacterium]
MELDETDFRIIRLLVEDGRAPYARIGAEVGLSAHAAADRVRRLRRADVITAFTAVVDFERMGRGLEAYIDIRLMPNTDPDRFEAHAATIDTIEELAFVTGRFDYQVRVACTDPDQLDRTVRALRQTGGAAQTETRIVLRSTSKGTVAAKR